jgi:hypothetical protein
MMRWRRNGGIRLVAPKGSVVLLGQITVWKKGEERGMKKEKINSKMPLPIKFGDQLLKRVGHVWSSRVLDAGPCGARVGDFNGGHGGNGSKKRGRDETEKSSVKSL